MKRFGSCLRENNNDGRAERKKWSSSSLTLGNYNFALEALDLVCAELDPPIITSQRVVMNPQGTYTVTLMIGREGSCCRTMSTLDGATELAARVLVSHLRSKIPAVVERNVSALRSYYEERQAGLQTVLEQGPYAEVGI